MHQRNETLDLLRGLGIIIMVFTHALAYYLKDKFVFFLWDWSHFVVVTFVFVSAYLFFKKNEGVTGNFFTYFKKRILRLLVPYYIFLAFMFGSFLIFEPKNISLPFIWQNLTLTGGIDLNWLTILFIYFTFINPLLLFLWQKRTCFFVYAAAALAAGIVFLFYYPNAQYKLVMWLPWSLIAIFAFYFVKNEDKKYFFILTAVVSLLTFINLYVFLQGQKHTVVLQYNKYPPNIYYLSYGITCLTVLYYVFSKITIWEPVKKFIFFYSQYSYEIFFSHWWVLYIISKIFPYWNWHWAQFTTVVFFTSLVTQLLLNQIIALLHQKKTI